MISKQQTKIEIPYNLSSYAGFYFYAPILHFLQVLIIFREILIINITNGICKSPSAWRGPLHTLSQTWLEVLQHIILGNECHCLVEIILYRSVILLPHVTIVVCKLTCVFNIAKHQISQLVWRRFQFLVVRDSLPANRESGLWLLSSPRWIELFCNNLLILFQ